MKLGGGKYKPAFNSCKDVTSETNPLNAMLSHLTLENINNNSGLVENLDLPLIGKLALIHPDFPTDSE